ncbi:MAG: OFA family MFS transporter [Desulfobacterales bacterium]|nr:OFA family MFS transporter [Desulfobacterales bacterium]
MSTEHSSTPIRGWVVTAAGSILALSFGILYVWSVITSGIPDSWGWTHADKALPYSIMATVFSLVMVPAGRLQDRLGPRPVILLGGFLCGLGCVMSGLGGASKAAYVLGFGFVTGTGVGFGYSALTPAAIKWFPREKTGLVAGLVVAGTGLASVPLAPLTQWLLTYFAQPDGNGGMIPGVSATLIALGMGVWAVTATVGWLVTNPPAGFQPEQSGGPQADEAPELSPGAVLKTAQFWILYLMYFSGASAGLVYIGVAADIGRQALGEMAFITVVVLAAGNTLGRILAGAISDKIGRHQTLFLEFLAQAFTIFLLVYFTTNKGGGSTAVILAIVFAIGLNYGGNLTLFPAVTKEYFGVRHFGVNYGCLFTAFGSAGMIMPWLNGHIKDSFETTAPMGFLIIALLCISALLSLYSRRLGPPVPGGEGRTVKSH